MYILICEFKLSCYQASRVLNLPYTNAKVIYRAFKDKNEIISNHNLNKTNKYGMSEESLMKRPYVIREDAVQKLRVAMQDGLLTVT